MKIVDGGVQARIGAQNGVRSSHHVSRGSLFAHRPCIYPKDSVLAISIDHPPVEKRSTPQSHPTKMGDTGVLGSIPGQG
jgi:hypothetical protein